MRNKTNKVWQAISFLKANLERVVITLAIVFSLSAIIYSFKHNYIVAYGDAESHLNIAKRVIDSLTPGLAQLGGIWLPLPHLLMVPFVYFDFLWRSGIAGSVISGLGYIISCLFIYKLSLFFTQSRLASFIAFLVFAFNPNVLYMQSTPMTEIVLITFFILSTYYFVKFIKNDGDLLALVFAAFFALCASLSRYDGWFLTIFEAIGILLFYLGKPNTRKILEGKIVLFSSLAFFGVFSWLIWDYLILGDPFYFTNSPFSAKSQQQGWLVRGELPTLGNIQLSFLYYTITFLRNLGLPFFILYLFGLFVFIVKEKTREKFIYILLLFVPYIFYILTLYIGQSVIFIPDLTPKTFEWKLFNVRYGLMMVPVAAFFIGYLFSKSRLVFKYLVILLFVLQLIMYFGPKAATPITLQDGVSGLSSYKKPDAQKWIYDHYDYGLVLLDDYARTLSVIRTRIPMRNVIYIGNKPYWEESLREPEKYARWVVMQKDDAVWKEIYQNPSQTARLYKYFTKAYTSPDILIFKRSR